MHTKKPSPAVARLVAEQLRADAADPQECAAIDREIDARVEAAFATLKITRKAKRSPDPLRVSAALEAMAAKILVEAGL